MLFDLKRAGVPWRQSSKGHFLSTLPHRVFHASAQAARVCHYLRRCGAIKRR